MRIFSVYRQKYRRLSYGKGNRPKTGFFRLRVRSLENRVTPSYVAAPHYPTDAQPGASVAADFNHDGKLDLALASWGDSTVSVLLGNGNGSFQDSLSNAADNGTQGLTVGDFNGDGNPDLVAGNFNSDDISVLLGNGDGTFLPAVDYHAGLSPVAVVTGDFNGDGKTDLAVANLSAAVVSVFLGNGDGTFTAAPDANADFNVTALAVGDFNGDGKTDLAAVCGSSNKVDILLGQGNGTFQSPISLAVTGPRDVRVADLNGDGKLDVIAVSTSPNAMQVFQGNGDGTFKSPAVYPMAADPVGVAIGDLNGDGHPDIVTANFFSDSAQVFLNKGDGTFQPANQYTTDSQSSSVQIADLNGDGIPDLAVANFNSNDVSILLGNGNGTFVAARNFVGGDTPPFGIVSADINGDGKQDLVVTNRTGDSLSVMLGNGDSTFQAPISTSTGLNSAAEGLAVADLDGDGKLDVVTANASSNDVSVLLGNGDGSFQSAVHYNVGSHPDFVAIADFNGDGKLDLVVTNNFQNTVSVLLGNGDGTVQAAQAYATEAEPDGVAAGDLNGDGQLDLVVSCYGANHVDVLLGNGNGTFGTAVGYAANFNPSGVAAGDVNKDGKLDVVVASGGAGFSLLPGNGDGTLGSPVDTFLTSSGSSGIQLADINADGNLDVVVAGDNDNKVSVVLGKGDGTFQPALVFATGPSPRFAAAGDFNGDGRLGVAAACSGDNYVTILSNAPNPPDTFQLSVPTPVSPGEPFNITVTALNYLGVIDTQYRGTIHFASSDGTAGLPGDYTFQPDDAGQQTFSVALSTLGSQTITISDPAGIIAPQIANVTVALDTFSVTVPNKVNAQAPFTFTVTVDGPSGAVDTEYQGTVHFTSSDGSAVLPGDYTFQPSDAGSRTFTATLATLGTQTIVAHDPLGIMTSYSASTTVAAGSFSVTGIAAKAVPGTPFQLTITVLDATGAVESLYRGTVHFASSEPTAALPADYTFQPGDRGRHTFTLTLFTGGQPTITISDTRGSITALPITEPVESGPELAPIPDQTMALSSGNLVLGLPAPTDADGDVVMLFQPVVTAFNPAYELRQHLGLYEYIGATGATYFQNAFGQNEKSLFGAIDGSRYLILPTGQIRQYIPGQTTSFAQTTLTATLDPSYWLNPVLLTTATLPPAPAVTAVLNPITDVLTITPPAHYTGIFRITLTASDGTLSASQSFLVTVTDSRPTLDPIADQTMPHSQGSLQVTLQANDSDPGAIVTFPAPIVSGYNPAYDLQQQLNFYEYLSPTGPTYFQSAQWNNGKWLFSAVNGGRYLILPNGQVLQYVSGASSVADLIPVTTLGPSVWVNPTLLTSAPAPLPPVGVTASISGNVLTVTAPTSYVGTFRVSATATDGTLNTTQSFVVHVTDSRPILQSIPDKIVAPGAGAIPVTLSANDPDAGDSVAFLPPTVAGSNAAYELQRLLGLYVYQGPGGPSYFQSATWNNGKWLFSSLTGNRYLILPSGEVLQYVSGATSVAGLTPVAQLDPSVYINPSLLTAPTVPATPLGVTASIRGGVLTVNVPTSYTGTFRVWVTVTDGGLQATQSFLVDVTGGTADDTPVLGVLPDLSVDHLQLLPTIPLNVTDSDQTPTVLQALTARPGPAYDLQQQLGLYAYQGVGGPSYFQSAQWSSGKWLFSSLNGGRYVILPNGQVLQYIAGATTVTDLARVMQLDPSVYLDPTLLTGPAALPISTTVTNTSLLLTPLASFTGSFWAIVPGQRRRASDRTALPDLHQQQCAARWSS